MFKKICSYDNLYLAYKKARKRKTLKPYVIKFEENLPINLIQLRYELLSQIYKPRPLTNFIIKDPKTRKISKSDFRDRVVHHALCNIIEPILDKGFIYDSYANRLDKGTFNAIKRFDCFKRKVSKNNTKVCFVLKADVKHYFDSVDHDILISILKKKIKDEKVLSLIKIILKNHKTRRKGKGMPLGNLTSQFFANVYLHELDQFAKHKLRTKYYIRYVDDFVILHHSRKTLERYKERIDEFLKTNLKLELHPDKSKIYRLDKGIGFLGFRIFYYHKLIKKKNLKKFERKFKQLKKLYREGTAGREKIVECFEGWLAFVSHGSTYKYRRELTKLFNQYFQIEDKIKFNQVKKHENFTKKIEESNMKFSTQKTLYLFRKGLSLKDIAAKRNIKESTVWSHLARLIEYNQVSLWKILPKDKISKILPKIYNPDNKLKEIKNRLKDNSITFDEIDCVLAFVKSKNKRKNVSHIINWYKKACCFRKCNFSKKQIKECIVKLDYFISKNSSLEITQKEFLNLFNNHMNICKYNIT